MFISFDTFNVYESFIDKSLKGIENKKKNTEYLLYVRLIGNLVI